jgi:glutaredoxin
MIQQIARLVRLFTTSHLYMTSHLYQTFYSLQIAELRNELERLGRSNEGNKQILVSRLYDAAMASVYPEAVEKADQAQVAKSNTSPQSPNIHANGTKVGRVSFLDLEKAEIELRV